MVLCALFLVAALPLILLLGPRGRPGEDQINYHQPAILTFARQLPRPDVHDYLSATTPGYHLALAGIARTISDDPRALQLAGMLFTLLLLAVVARLVFAAAAWPASLLLALPFACSMYILQAGVWLLPDNAGWLFVALCLLLALREPFDRRTILLGGMALVGLVLVRQVHLWAAGVLWAAAWLSPGLEAPGGIPQLLARFPQRLRRLAPMLLASLPAFIVLALFVRDWGGLTPPTFQGQYQGVNLASFAFVLSLLAIGSVFFAGYVWEAGLGLLRARPIHALLALGAGALLAAVPDTTYSVEFGRSSGLWNLVKALPTIAGHTSPVIVVLSSCGALALLAWWRAVGPRNGWICLGALVAFAAAQAFAYQLWQRYNEPMVLLMLAVMASRSRRSCAPDRPGSAARAAGPAVLAMLLAALSAYSTWRMRPAAVYDLNKINLRPHPTPAPTP